MISLTKRSDVFNNNKRLSALLASELHQIALLCESPLSALVMTSIRGLS
ncbi:hypothetical protein EHW99_1924 [Erwinia amylovora]|uniref:Uncharacterized protein n=2 Tax=Erwinia amylovora TaxID=552 RepID=A0A831A1A3_ERWAM|nr:hypothetical protein EaACW_1665 [Erwinia amylovora ACW56400]QJQ54628.1 hypothetical protein EHX00_1924 [Erwinia amylovora]CBA20608.1 hypothetical protein predicted by Glimmer/Critica [Erwinia amylovora CFBP1430]CCO78512.1 hypothetical protein BN432_1709 [Erwinia amylovora Ea356]CCO82306.1 hypothetical protein BN433_1731 [Erwinia amylovora Ea266]CCO86094.1 hypothetical protein BN434_1701 [Erwinia amylovora CFBP 2585]CCO89884.1 hypothetical protein BN435_1708 [Erwinia amylovora 01SFR-BO]CCO